MNKKIKKCLILFLIFTFLCSLNTGFISLALAPQWTPNTYYTINTIASYNQQDYKCIQSHTSLVGWEPPSAPALWQLYSPTDTQAPSVPQGLAVSSTTDIKGTVKLSWQPSTDNVGVTGYNIKRGGVNVGTSSTPSFRDTNLTVDTHYIYTVQAYDAAGNLSGQSQSIDVVLAKTDYKALVLIYDPIMTDGKRCHEKYHTQSPYWGMPDDAVNVFKEDIKKLSGGTVNLDLTIRRVNDFPPVSSGTKYTPSTYEAWMNGGTKLGGPANYTQIVQDQGLANLVNSGQMDMVFFFAPNESASLAETTVIGSTPFYSNGALVTIPNCKNFYLFSFSTYCDMGQGLFHIVGHSVECAFSKVYDNGLHISRNWPDRNAVKLYVDNTNYPRDNFTSIDRNIDDFELFLTTGTVNYGYPELNSNGSWTDIAALAIPGRANVGTIHNAPNSSGNYDYGGLDGNEYEVDCYADDWYTYPNFTGKHRIMNSSDFGAWYDYTKSPPKLERDERAFSHFWYGHLPKNPGTHDGILNNWWQYVFDYHFFDGSLINYNVVYPELLAQPSVNASPVNDEYGTEGAQAENWSSWFVNDYGYSMTVSNETTNVISGSNSLKYNIKCSDKPANIQYPKSKDANWNLTDKEHLVFYAKIDTSTISLDDFIGANPVVSLCNDAGNKISFIPRSGNLNYFNSTGWIYFDIPISGDSVSWRKKEIGRPDLSKINYCEISIRKNKFNGQQPNGYTMYLDGLRFLDYTSAVPAAPTGLSSSNTTFYSTTINWTGSTGSVGYNIYRDGIKIGISDANTLTFTDSKLAASTSYSYTVKGFNTNSVESSASTPLSVTTLAAPGLFSDDFNDGNALGWSTFGGNWIVHAIPGQYSVGDSGSMEGVKSIADNRSYSNFSLEYDISISNDSSYSSAGTIFRVGNISSLGPDSFDGYQAAIDAERDLVSVWKFENNNAHSLGQVSMPISANTTYHMKVEAVGSNIYVYVTDMTTPKLKVYDSKYSGGSFGFRTYRTHAHFDNLSINSLPQSADFSDDFSAGTSKWVSCGGNWSVSNGQYSVTSGLGDKSIAYDTKFVDLILEGDISISNGTSYSDAGMLFRASNIWQGTDTLYGYGVFIDAYQDKIKLCRFDGNSCVLVSQASVTVNPNTSYHVKVVADKNQMKVFMNNMSTPLISASDSTYTVGSVGLRSYSTAATFDNIKAYMIDPVK
ncbi:MAG: hypothetical protein N3B21_04430 [Clostridia bacterium]|nr:hypothetical protein [Clostridia bacterium]